MITSPSTAKLSCEQLWKVYGSIPSSLNPEIATNTPLVDQLADIHKSGGIVACADVTFDVPEGAIFVIMGLSGSGKSTVLRCLSRLVEPSCGVVLLDGKNLLAASKKDMINIRRHKMGMVFQNFGLLPHLTALQNVAFPLRAQGMPHDKRLHRAQTMIDLVGLQGREEAYPNELSGGQQQRVGIARSLAVEPDIWFLDEPFSALDPLIRTQMQDEFLRLQKQLNKTIVFVTHDMLEALRLADMICIMKDGCVVQIGTPSEIVLNPANSYVGEFTGDVPLGKILCADAIMGPCSSTSSNNPVVMQSTVLEDVMKLFNDTTENVDVMDDDGSICGSLTPLQIIRALYQDDAGSTK